MLILICWYVAVILVKDASDVNKTHTVDDSQAQKQKVFAPTLHGNRNSISNSFTVLYV